MKRPKPDLLIPADPHFIRALREVMIEHRIRTYKFARPGQPLRPAANLPLSEQRERRAFQELVSYLAK